MPTIDQIQKKIKIKLKTLNLSSKDNRRIIKRSKESELVKQKQLFKNV